MDELFAPDISWTCAEDDTHGVGFEQLRAHCTDHLRYESAVAAAGREFRSAFPLQIAVDDPSKMQVRTTESPFDADEREAMSLLDLFMRRMDTMGLEGNWDEMAHAIHTLQQYPVQRMLHRLYPEAFGCWFKAPSPSSTRPMPPRTGYIHLCAPPGETALPCCGRTENELGIGQVTTATSLVTCPGREGYGAGV